MKTSPLAVGLLLFLAAAFTAQAAEGCKLLPTWHSVPESVRNVLSQDMGPISERGGAFNSTDAVSNDTPRSRFFGACVQGNKVIVAIERGGIASALQLTEFVGDTKAREWYRPIPSGPFTPALAVPPATR